MKTLRRLIISPRPFTKKQITDRENLATLLSIPGVLKVQNEYRHIPNILDSLKLETSSKGDDLDEHSLRLAINEPNYHNVHLRLTDKDWEKLGLRMTLYGQSQEIDGQGITYGRAAKNRLKYYSTELQQILTEETLNEWHELDHTIRALLDVDPTSTHYHFYGFAEKYKYMEKKLQDSLKIRRWTRKPDPLAAWQAIPWERLPDTEEKQKINLLQQIADLLLVILSLTKQQKPAAKLVKPLRDWDKQLVSQVYGNYNPSLYKLTGHHIGTDFAVPKGTPIYAPADGEVVEAGYSNSLGNYIVYKYAPSRWLVALHLNKRYPAFDLGKPFGAGEVIAEVGDTGLITGVHAHLEVWTVNPNDRRSVSGILTKDNWKTITLDPLKAF